MFPAIAGAVLPIFSVLADVVLHKGSEKDALKVVRTKLTGTGGLRASRNLSPAHLHVAEIWTTSRTSVHLLFLVRSSLHDDRLFCAARG